MCLCIVIVAFLFIVSHIEAEKQAQYKATAVAEGVTPEEVEARENAREKELEARFPNSQEGYRRRKLELLETVVDRLQALETIAGRFDRLESRIEELEKRHETKENLLD